MIILTFFAFLAGVITVLSPCILPILPIILSSSVGERVDRARPLGVIVGFVASFTFFTLFLSSIVRLFGVPADSMRLVSVGVIGLFGVSLLIPKFQVMMEQLFTKVARFLPNSQGRSGFGGGVIIGLSIGLLWTPCVGPILASVISLAITGAVTLDALLITLAYSLGTAIPMFMIMRGGQATLQRVPWLVNNLGVVQKIFGGLMVLTAVGIYFNIDRQFQTYILETFPNYAVTITQIEENSLIESALDDTFGR